MATSLSLLLSLGFNVRRQRSVPVRALPAGFGMGIRRMVRGLNDA
jgi:hypothetical protein